MDAATTALLRPSCISSSPSVVLPMPLSLRPAGGSRFTGRPNSGSIGGKLWTHSFSGTAVGSRDSGFGSVPATFLLRQEKRASTSRGEVIRYSKEEILRLKEDWTSLPEEIAGSDVQRSSTALEDSARREPSYIPIPERRVEPDTGDWRGESSYIPISERTVTPDTRDWRNRTALPATPPDQERQERPRDQHRERPIPKENRDGPGDRAQQTAPSQNHASEQSSSPNTQPQGGGHGPAIVKAASPWSARRGAQSEKEKVIKTVKGILNKLTPEKYDTLLKQFTQSGITSAVSLQGVISLVFDKAVLEPTFCSMYALLCVDLSKALPEFPAADRGDKPITFRRILLNTCQSEFEGADALRDEIRQSTAQERKRAEKERNVKLRTLGNIKFIGELFKQKMIPEKIVHACIQDLLGVDSKAVPAEENVEALCQLLSTMGKALDANLKSRVAIDSYFARLTDFGNRKTLPSRIRFMVHEILDVRRNNWIPRREEVRAKTISEVHAEAEQKLGLRAGSASLKVGLAGSAVGGMLPGGAMMPGAPGAGRGGMMPGMPGMPGFVRRGAHYNQSLDEELWEEVSRRRKSKRELLRPVTSACNRLPIPGGMTRNLPGTGVTFVSKPSALLGGSVPLAQTPTSPLRNGPGPADPGTRVPPSNPVAEVSAKIVEPESRPPSSARPPSGQQVSQLKKKSESLLNEYFSVMDLKEALLCVKELGGPEFHPQFVDFVLSVVFDKRDREQELVSKLFDYLHSEKVLSSESIRAGFLISGEQLDDLAVDAPLAPNLMGKLLASLLLSKAADISLLVEVSKKSEDDYLRRAVLGATFKSLLSQSSEGQTMAYFRTLSTEDLSLFGDKSDLSQTLNREGLDALTVSL